MCPVKEGEELDVTIESVGEKGDGLCRKDGFVLFIPDTRVGDKVRVRVTKVLRKVGFAEVVGSASGAPASAEEETKKDSTEEDTSEKTSEEESSSEDTEDFGEEDTESQEDSEDFGDEPEDEGEEEKEE